MEQKNQSRSQIWRIRAIAVGAAAGAISAVAALAAFAAGAVVLGSYGAVAPWAPWVAFSLEGAVSGAVCAGLSRRNPLPNGLCAAALGAVTASVPGLFAGGGGGFPIGLPLSLVAGAAGVFAELTLKKRKY